ncbi:MAG: hypothetical protein JOZ48_14805 [Acidobacteriaceae bacterium]|nr:hypothetical protein [Acidobacteriaceae bacterium]
MTDNNHVLVVNYRIQGDELIPETVQPWSPVPILYLDLFRNFDVAPDGKHIVAAPHPDPRDEREANSRITVLLNFFDDVKRKIP